MKESELDKKSTERYKRVKIFFNKVRPISFYSCENIDNLVMEMTNIHMKYVLLEIPTKVNETFPNNSLKPPRSCGGVIVPLDDILRV